MLFFHDYLKGNAEFQSGAPKNRLEFQPGWAWTVFTDVAPHAVESGRHALEQALIVLRTSLGRPERAPLSILEKFAGLHPGVDAWNSRGFSFESRTG
jgi:hypothetical protein